MHGHALEHHGGGLLVADVVGKLHQRAPPALPFGRIAAERTDKADAVTDLDVGDAGADRDHFAGAFIAGDERHADRRRIQRPRGNTCR